MHWLARLTSQLLDVLAPPSCAACDAPALGAFCDGCRLPSPVAPEPRSLLGVPLLVVGNYAPPLSTAISRFKYEGRAELAASLSPLLAPALARLEPPAGTALVPVPLHPRRLAARGYNQAALVARELARASGLAYEPRLLARTRDTERQVGKARAARLTNATGAFALRRAGLRRALLVDDVVTTGSTVRACAQALAEGNVELVAILALAQASPLAELG